MGLSKSKTSYDIAQVPERRHNQTTPSKSSIPVSLTVQKSPEEKAIEDEIVERVRRDSFMDPEIELKYRAQLREQEARAKEEALEKEAQEKEAQEKEAQEREARNGKSNVVDVSNCSAAHMGNVVDAIFEKVHLHESLNDAEDKEEKEVHHVHFQEARAKKKPEIEDPVPPVRGKLLQRFSVEEAPEVVEIHCLPPKENGKGAEEGHSYSRDKPEAAEIVQAEEAVQKEESVQTEEITTQTDAAEASSANDRRTGSSTEKKEVVRENNEEVEQNSGPHEQISVEETLGVPGTEGAYRIIATQTSTTESEEFFDASCAETCLRQVSEAQEATEEAFRKEARPSSDIQASRTLWLKLNLEESALPPPPSEEEQKLREEVRMEAEAVIAEMCQKIKLPEAPAPAEELKIEENDGSGNAEVHTSTFVIKVEEGSKEEAREEIKVTVNKISENGSDGTKEAVESGESTEKSSPNPASSESSGDSKSSPDDSQSSVEFKTCSIQPGSTHKEESDDPPHPHKENGEPQGTSEDIGTFRQELVDGEIIIVTEKSPRDGPEGEIERILKEAGDMEVRISEFTEKIGANLYLHLEGTLLKFTQDLEKMELVGDDQNLQKKRKEAIEYVDRQMRKLEQKAPE